MLQPNRYLKELGIDEKYWLFDEEKKKIDNRYLPDAEGFVNAEFFNLDTTLSLYIYSHLCYFRDNCLVASPGNMPFEEWEEIVNKMIEAFKLQIIEDKTWDPYEFGWDRRAQKIASKNRRKKIDYGMRLFIKYYHCLWY